MNFCLDSVTRSVADHISDFFTVIKSVFSSFNIIDAIDILLLTVLLFFAFRFFKNRKAGALLIGIALCAIVLFFATLFELDAISFVLSSLFKVGVIAIIIIFQPEIREALEKLGAGSLSGLHKLGDNQKRKVLYRTVIEHICTAVNDLSRTKTGALIVLERTTQVDEICHTGISINADVSSFLIRNIFFDKAPLHDGALVISDGRIAAAGCLLPLTRRSDVDGDLGTRHRAAIGMSETSDAVTIIVSEETGTISVAYDCALTRDFTPEALRKYLFKMMIREKELDS